MAFGLLTGTSGIQPDFLSKLEALRRGLPNNLGAQIGVKSGYRSPAHQAELFARAVQRYGSPAAARKWVAPPGHSQHNRGYAVDLSYGSPEAMRAAHQYAAQYGLTFPMSYENWHIEPVGARGGGGATTSTTSPTSTLGLTGTEPAAAPATPENSLADMLSKVSVGGPPQSTGLIGGDSPPPNTNLQFLSANAPEMSPPTTAAPDVGSLAGLFTLPTIGSLGDPSLDPNATLPGQAKPLKPKVWT